MATAREVQLPEADELGPRMLALDERRRKFVLARVHGAKNPTQAAKSAGYSEKTHGYLRVQGHRLMRMPDVLMAIREESEKILDAGVFVAANALVEIAANKKHKDRQKAAEKILAVRGLGEISRHHVVVEDKRTEAELVEFIQATAKRHGLDPRLLLGPGTIEGECVDVTPLK